MNRTYVNVYPDLLNSSSQINAYKIQDTFQFNLYNKKNISFLSNILKNSMVHTQTSVINYFQICKLLNQNKHIVRIGGDGYDEVSVQIFSLKKYNHTNYDMIID